MRHARCEMRSKDHETTDRKKDHDAIHQDRSYVSVSTKVVQKTWTYNHTALEHLCQSLLDAVRSNECCCCCCAAAAAAPLFLVSPFVVSVMILGLVTVSSSFRSRYCTASMHFTRTFGASRWYAVCRYFVGAVKSSVRQSGMTRSHPSIPVYNM